MRQRFRGAQLGACVGLASALALHLWYMYATYASRMSGEGIGFITYMLAMLLGCPATLLVALCIEFLADLGIGLPGLSEYYALLLGIVINWALIFSLVGYFRRPRPNGPAGRHREAD